MVYALVIKVYMLTRKEHYLSNMNIFLYNASISIDISFKFATIEVPIHWFEQFRFSGDG